MCSDTVSTQSYRKCTAMQYLRNFTVGAEQYNKQYNKVYIG